MLKSLVQNWILPSRPPGKQQPTVDAARADEIKRRFPDAVSWQLDIIHESESDHSTPPERILSISESTRFLIRNQVEGDFVECGLLHGKSMTAIAKTLHHMRAENRQIWLYECGNDNLPQTSTDVCDEVSQIKADSSREMDRDESFSLERVCLDVAATGYPKSNIHFYRESQRQDLFANKPDKIALLKLDSEWYETTKYQLESLFPLLVPGGVLIVDEYGNWDGCRRAVDEYFDQNQVRMLLNRIDHTARIGIHWPQPTKKNSSATLRRSRRSFREAG